MDLCLSFEKGELPPGGSPSRLNKGLNPVIPVDMQEDVVLDDLGFPD